MMRLLQRVLLAAALAGGAAAHELDHYNLPAGTRFADLGPHLTATTCEHIRNAVDKLNARMAVASGADLERLRSPDALVAAVCAEFPPVVDYIAGLERQFHDPDFTAGYAGLIVAWRSPACIYDGTSLPLEPRGFFLLWRSSLLRVNGVFLGSDKLGHMVHNGMNYYLAYRAALRAGADEDSAVRAAVRIGVDGNFLLCERGLLGAYTSSVISNADLAANYLGLLFYLNLTQDVQLQGRTQGRLVLLEREWRLAPHVRPDGDFFVNFFSNHLDEVLNPNIYEPRMHSLLKPRIAAQCARIRAWYADADGTPRPRDWFEQQQRELSTYFGVDYGFIRNAPGGFISIALQCDEPPAAASARSPAEPSADLPASAASPAGRRAFAPAADPLRRTELMRAVRSGQIERLRAALPRAQLDALDLDGETALHHAARRGQAELVHALLAAGARPDVANRYGNTPLHLAAGGGADAAAAELLAAGATVAAANAFGATPLHAAAAAGHERCVALLLERGASAALVDAAGSSPLRYAVRARQHAAAARLRAAQADRGSAAQQPHTALPAALQAPAPLRSAAPAGGAAERNTSAARPNSSAAEPDANSAERNTSAAGPNSSAAEQRP